MCLFANHEIPAPTEDKVFWKIVSKKNRSAPFFRKKYICGTTVVASWPNRFSRWLHGLNTKKQEYRRGVLHVYTTEEAALSSLRWFNGYHFADPDGVYDHPLLPFMVIKVLCKPEHFIAFGDGHEAAYTQVEVLT